MQCSSGCRSSWNRRSPVRWRAITYSLIDPALSNRSFGQGGVCGRRRKKESRSARTSLARASFKRPCRGGLSLGILGEEAWRFTVQTVLCRCRALTLYWDLGTWPVLPGLVRIVSDTCRAIFLVVLTCVILVINYRELGLLETSMLCCYVYGALRVLHKRWLVYQP